MKKVALSLATVLAAAAFAPEASAVPSFARQTGMACTACHFQHFPVLNGFGNAFKASGYTIMGAQGKVEGDHLSIPDTLNASILLKARYQKTDGAVTTQYPGTDTNTGQWQIPDELSLFLGGRIADSDMIKIGFMNENNMIGGPAGGIVAGFKLPIVVDAGAAKIMAIPFITDALGLAYGYEQSNTGMARGVRWAEHRKEVSAAQYTGIGSGLASGVAFVAQTDMGYVNISKWSPQFAYAGGATGVRMSSTWLRVAATPTVADWAMHVGFGVASGTSSCADPLNTVSGNPSATKNQLKVVSATYDTHERANDCQTNGTVIDFQGQGQIAGMETSVYLQNATAPKSKTGERANLFNTNTTNDIKATTIGADFSVIPHTLHLGVALRNAKNNSAKSDNATTLTAVYDLFQNVAAHINYSKYSGEAYSGTPANGTSLTTFMLEAAW